MDLAAAYTNAERFARGQIGVHQHLIARLNAVEHVWPDPGGASHLDLEARARGRQQPPDLLASRQARVHHHTVRRKSSRHQTRQNRLLADAANRQNVQAGNSAGGQGLGQGAQLVAAQVARGGDAVGDQQHALEAMPLLGQLGHLAQSPAQIRGAQGAALAQLFERAFTQAACLASVDGLDELIEGDDRQHGIATLGQVTHQGLQFRDLVGESQGPRGAGVEEHEQRRNGLQLFGGRART